MANQQDHLMAATGVDVDDAPAPAAPPSTIVILAPCRAATWATMRPRAEQRRWA
jgi:hypothetical protein